MNAVPAAPGGARAQPHPTTIALVDDRGSSVTARVGHASWGGGSWEATYTSDKPLSPDTRWIEVDGNRLELPERHATPPVRVDQIEPLEPLRAALYAEILSTDRRRAGADTVDIACRALVSTGASDEDDPMLTELRAIADAVTNAMPAPWTSRAMGVPGGALSDRRWTERHRAGGSGFRRHRGVLRPDRRPDFGADLLLARARRLTGYTSADALSRRDRPNSDFPSSGGRKTTAGTPMSPLPTAVGGSDVVAEGVVTSLSSLDPKATELTLFPTGKHSRGVVTVHLSALEEV